MLYYTNKILENTKSLSYDFYLPDLLVCVLQSPRQPWNRLQILREIDECIVYAQVHVGLRRVVRMQR